jgi:hypothetical protein
MLAGVFQSAHLHRYDSGHATEVGLTLSIPHLPVFKYFLSFSNFFVKRLNKTRQSQLIQHLTRCLECLLL